MLIHIRIRIRYLENVNTMHCIGLSRLLPILSRSFVCSLRKRRLISYQQYTQCAFIFGGDWICI